MTFERIKEAREAGYSDDEIKAEIIKVDPKMSGVFNVLTLDAVFEPPVAQSKTSKPPTKIQPERGPIIFPTEEQAEQQAEASGEVSFKRQALATGTNIAISEGGKAGGTALGGMIGAAVSTPTAGAAAPVTIPVGAAIGYVTSALGSGFAGSVAEQEIEGKEDISWGRAGVNAVFNLVPGGIGVLQKTIKGKNAITAGIKKVIRTAANRPVVSSAATAGVFSPAQMAGERYAETGELPTYNEMVRAGLVGVGFGAGIGKLSVETPKLLSKFVSKDPNEVTRLVREGNAEAVNYIDIVSQNVSPDDFLSGENAKVFVNEIIQTSKARLSPSKVIGEKANEAIIDARNLAMAGKDVGALLNKKVSRFIQQSKDPQATEKLVYEHIKGSKGPLPLELEPIADDIYLFKKSVGKYQDELLLNDTNGQRPLPKLLREKIEQSINDGDYLSREYEFFLNPKFKPSPKAAKELKARLIADGMDVKSAESYIADLNAKKASGPDEVERFVYSQNAGILKERKDLSPELRRYLGEVKGAGERMEGTMSKLSRLVAYDSSDYTIKTTLRDLGLAKIAGEGADDISFTPLNLRRGVAEIDGETLYVPKPVQTAVNSLYGMKADEVGINIAQKSISNFFKTGTALSKAVKVLGNPPSYAVQVYSNLSNILQQGMNPFVGAKAGAKVSAAQFGSIGSRSKAATLAEIKKYKELGLMGSNVLARDISSGLEDGLGKAIEKPVGQFGKLYSVPDITGRIIVYENNLSKLKSFSPSATNNPAAIAKLEKTAAVMTNATYQNYDYLNESLKTASRYGALGQFSAFTFEFMRNQYNQARLAKRMMDGSFAKELAKDVGEVNQKAIAVEGAKRLASMVAMYSATIGAFTQWNKRESGFDEDQQKALKESVLPEWDKNKILAMYRGKEGKIYWKNGSYLLPQAQAIAPFKAALEETSFKDAVLTGMETLWEDVGGEGNFLLNALVPAIGNYDPATSDKISKRPSKIDSAIEKTEWFISEAFTPGIFREIERAQSTQRNQPKSQTILRQAGIRVNDTTIQDGARFKINGIKTNLSTLSGDLSYQRSKRSPEEFETEYQRINEVYKQNIAELSKHANNYKKLDMSEDEVIKMFRENGVGAKITLAALDGKTVDLPKTPRISITDRYEELTGDRKEKEKQIREIAKTEPMIAKSLIEKHKQVLKDSALEISERDKAIRSLGADDGTRSEYIWNEMMQSSDPDAVLRKYVRKNVVSPQVMYDIKLRQKANK